MKFLKSPWMAILILIGMMALRIEDPSFVESVRLRYFDTLITSKPKTDNNIVIANIDEAAIEKYGQWPFSRDVYASIIADLYNHNAGLVVFDVLMAERDRLGGDKVLSEALGQMPVILPSVPSELIKNGIRAPGSAVLNPEYLDRLVNYPGLISNIDSLNDKATGVGIVNTLPEIDGVNRRIPLVVGVNGSLQPSIALEVLRVASGDSTFQVKLSELGVEKLRIPAFGPISTDPLSRIWIDWSQSSKTISITDIPDLGGAIVIVGPAATGISNPISTAIGPVYPHSVIGSVLGTLINNVNIDRPDWLDGAEILGIIVLSLISLLFVRFKYGFIAVITFTSSVYFLSVYLFDHYHMLMDPTFGILTLVLVYCYAYTVKFLSELRQKLQIKKQFGGYVSPVIVEKLQKNPELIKLGGETKELSVVMSDMRNFSTLGESYGDRVEEFTQVMNSYMTAISVPILKNDGCLIKFIGDASLHIHNAPVDDVNHACTAVLTGLQMIKAVDGFNEELAAIGKPPVGMGVGVNTGPTLVGNIGSKDRFGYDVLGDTVSLASRLEGQSKPYGVKLIIGESTAELVGHKFFLLELDKVAVKGKTVGVRMFTVLDIAGDIPDAFYLAQENHTAMIAKYRDKQFNESMKMCIHLMGSFDSAMDHYYEMWIDRCKEMAKKRLPKDWDGTYVATSK